MSKRPASKRARGKKTAAKAAPKPAQKLASELAREQEQFFGTDGGVDAMDAPLEVATPVPAPQSIPQSGSDMGQNDDLLIRARAAWEMGNWAVLAGLADRPLDAHPERGKLALLAAVGLAQLGDMAGARRFGQKAQSWGCPARLMAQVLIGGVMNSLGRVGCLLQDDTRARHYFETSIACVNPKADAAILGRARDINEKLALGLLPDAAAALDQSLDQMAGDQSITSGQAEIFRIQMDLLSGALALAQKRQQLSPDSDQAGTQDKDTRNRANSQLGQDLWVLEQTGFKRDGFFVEFGATDGVLLSNTLLLETEYGWNGICAEPNPQFFAKLRRNRNCRVGPDCIMGRSGQMVEFILADEFGGAAEFADYDSHASKRAAFRDSGEVITLQSISLDDFLKKYDAPRTIDYLSIDTEGSEYEILKAFPFADWDIRLLTVEHNFTPIREDIRILLEGHGYTRTEMQWDDWYAKAPAG